MLGRYLERRENIYSTTYENIVKIWQIQQTRRLVSVCNEETNMGTAYVSQEACYDRSYFIHKL